MSGLPTVAQVRDKSSQNGEETSVQLKLIRGITDAAIYIHRRGFEQHGEKFQVMPAARKKKEEKEKAKLERGPRKFMAFEEIF